MYRIGAFYLSGGIPLTVMAVIFSDWEVIRVRGGAIWGDVMRRTVVVSLGYCLR